MHWFTCEFYARLMRLNIHDVWVTVDILRAIHPYTHRRLRQERTKFIFGLKFPWHLRFLAANDAWLYWSGTCALTVYDKLVTSDTLLECMRRCQQEDQFNCSSLDFHAGDTAGDQPMCYLRNQSKSDVRASYTDTSYCYSAERTENGKENKQPCKPIATSPKQTAVQANSHIP